MKMNRGRSRLLHCFCPVNTTDDGSIKRKRYSSDSAKERTTTTEVLISPPDEEYSDCDVAGPGIGAKEKSSRRRFSRALKAVLFDIYLARRIASKKWRVNSFRSGSNLSKKSEKISRTINQKSLYRGSSDAAEDMLRTDSSRSSSIFSSSTNGSSSLSSLSSAASITSNSRSMSLRTGSFRANSMELKRVVKKHVPISTKTVSRGYFSSNAGLSLLLLSLLVLIIWGKVCAILCTSTWLFLLPRRPEGGDLVVKIVESSMDFDSDEYKKRVIMEGLLERSRSRML